MKKRKLLILVLLVVVLLGLGITGGKYYMDKQSEKEKIENQKDSVLEIKKTISGLKEIQFDKDGGQFSGTENDFGKWSIGAKLKLSDSSWYNVDVSKEGIEVMGEGFPDRNMQGGTDNSVKVTYSNGESEIIK